MPLKTPGWWYKRDAKGAPLTRYALWPLSLLWQGIGHYQRLMAKPHRSSVFVISVGNATLGGSGKTPIERELLRRFKKLNYKAAALTRGYGGQLEGPLKVSPEHTASEVGDEALMLSADYDVYIARDRSEGLKLIEAGKTQICVADDAHQNLKIHKNLHILVVDGDTSDGAWPFGDGSVFPMGPMREPLSAALKRTDVGVIWLPHEQAIVDPKLMKCFGDIPVYVARLIPMPKTPPAPVIAFAGIAKPWKFKNTLKSLGYDLIEFVALPDHAPIDPENLRGLYESAEARGVRVITTEKDWVKLGPEWRKRIDYLPITARFDDQAGFMRTLLEGVTKP